MDDFDQDPGETPESAAPPSQQLDVGPADVLKALQPQEASQQGGGQEVGPSDILQAIRQRPVDLSEALKSLKETRPPTVDDAKLAAAGEYYRQHAEEMWGPGSQDYALHRTPGVGLGRVLGKAYDLSGSLDRYKKGTHTDTDLFNIAEARAKQEYQAERDKDFGSRAFDFATHAPGMIAEFAASGGMTSAIGKSVATRLGGSLAARAAGYGAQTAAMTALTPSMYLEQATRANVDSGRDPLDPRGLAPAYGLAAAQMGAMGAVQKLIPGAFARTTGFSFEGGGLANAAGRVALEGASGPFAGAAADILGGVIDRKAGFGSIGQLLDGKYGEAMQTAAMHSLQFATFGAAHEIASGGKGPGKADPVMDAFVEAAKDLSDKGVLKDEAGKILQGPADIIAAIHAKDPNASRQMIEAAMKGLPEGPLRDLGMQMAARIPSHAEAQGPNPGIDELPPGTQEPAKTIAPGPPEAQSGPTDATSPAEGVDPQTGIQNPQTGTVAQPDEPSPSEKARYDELTAKRDEATALKTPAGDATALATGLEISDLVKKYPSLKRADGLSAPPRKVGTDPQDAVPQKVSDKITALKSQLERAQEEVDKATASETEEVKKKRVGERHDLEGARAKRLAWEGRERQIQAKLNDMVPQGELPRQQLDALFEEAGLTAKQQHVINQRLLGRTHESIAVDPIFKGNKGLRSTSQIAEKRALEKLGVNKESINKIVIQQQAQDAINEALANNKLRDMSSPVAAAVKSSSRRQADELEAWQDAWADHVMERMKNEGSGKLTAGDRADIARRISEGEDPPGYIAPGSEGAKGAGAAENIGEASAGPARSGGLQPSSAPGLEVKAPQDAGNPGLGTGPNAGESGAAGNVVSPLPPETQARLNAMVKAGDRVAVEDLKEAMKEHLDWMQIKQALEIAGPFPKGVVGPTKRSNKNGINRQIEGGERKYAAATQLREEVEHHAMHGGADPANQPLEVAPGVFFNKGQSVSKFIAPGEYADVHKEAKALRRTPAQAEELIRQVENEVAQQLKEEIGAARSGGGSGQPPVQQGTGTGPGEPAPGGLAGSVNQSPGNAAGPTQLAPNVFYHSPAGRGSGSGGVTASLMSALGSKPPLGGAADGGIMKGIIRNRNAEMHRKMEISAETLNKGAKFFDVWTEAAPDEATRNARFLEFTNAMEHDEINKLPAEIQEFAKAARDVIGTHEAELKKKGYLSTFVDHYMGHLWEDPNNPNATAEEISARINSKRSLAGGETYRKQRSMPTYQDGIDAGLTPRSWNPVDLVKMKADEVDKSIAGRDMFNEAKEQGLLKFQRLGGKTQAGWRMLNDKLARVLAPPETLVKEYFDKQQMEGLETFASSLGIDMARVTKGLGRAAGQAEVGGLGRDKVTTKFGTPEEILAHEIGHVLDKQYGMSAWLKDPVVSKELSDLADLRSSGRVSGEYRDYLRSDPERMANLVAAYLHAPELLNKVAPNAMAHLESLMAAHKELQPMRDIKPSLELGQREQMQRVAGPMLTGNYYGPNEVIDTIEKHLSPGLSGNKAFQAFRGVGNAMNMMQLGWSAYHYTGTALNAQMSAAALGFKMLSRGDVAEAAKQLPKALIPLYAAGSAVQRGLEMRRDYFAPGSGSPETQMLNEAWAQGGGRAKMDQIYRGSQMEAFQKAYAQFKAGQSDKALGVMGRMLPALNEAVSAPLMEHFVPLVKNGVGADMIRYEMSKLPPDASVNQKRAVFGKVVDSIDNRFGQMIYDNLFWNRTLKDSLMTAFRSVGWNLGTSRELGGGLKDIPSGFKGLGSGEGISHRLAYIGGMTAVTAMYGAMIQYLYTGKGPEEAKDFFFPKTGQTNPDGTAERKSLPVYMKDVYGLFNRADEGPMRIARNLWGMTKSKLHPAVIAATEMMNNEDFHGAAIDNPNDPILTRTKDDLAHFLKAFEPFSIRGFHEQGAAGGVQQFLGITKAPQYITKTSEEQRAAETGRKVTATPLAKKARADRGR